MENMRTYHKTRAVVTSKLRPCSSKHSKAGAGCKMARNIPCRTK